jgi:TPR repeat protein
LLGEIYHTGNHINRDLDLAKKYTEMAAKDSIDAAYNLSLLYMETDANYYDLEKSRAWAEIAAKKGYKPAQTQLGHMYLYGQGGVQSNVKAFAWLYIANESKYNDSEQENFELSKHMTLNERKRAIRLSNLYKKLYNL